MPGAPGESVLLVASADGSLSRIRLRLPDEVRAARRARSLAVADVARAAGAGVGRRRQRHVPAVGHARARRGDVRRRGGGNARRRRGAGGRHARGAGPGAAGRPGTPRPPCCAASDASGWRWLVARPPLTALLRRRRCMTTATAASRRAAGLRASSW